MPFWKPKYLNATITAEDCKKKTKKTKQTNKQIKKNKKTKSLSFNINIDGTYHTQLYPGSCSSISH